MDLIDKENYAFAKLRRGERCYPQSLDVKRKITDSEGNLDVFGEVLKFLYERDWIMLKIAWHFAIVWMTCSITALSP